MMLLGNPLWTTTGVGQNPPPPPPPVVDTVKPSGGIPADAPLRTRQQISDARKRLGLRDKFSEEAEEIIAQVAAQQAARLEQDAQKQLDELRGELKLRNLELERGYLEALAEEREALMDAEISERLAAKLKRDREALMFLVMVAAATV